MNSEPPVYQFEVSFFRRNVGVSYESGRRLRSRGILLPDALMADGRALYLASPEAVRLAKERIHAYRNQIARSRHNLCPKNLASA